MTTAAVAAVVGGGLAAAAVALGTGTLASARRRLTACGPAVGRPGAPPPSWRMAVPLAGVALVVSVCLLGAGPTLALAATAVAARAVTTRVRNRAAERANRAATIELLRAVAAELRTGSLGGAAFSAAVEAASEPLRSLLRPAAAVAGRGDATDVADAVAKAAAASRGSSRRGSDGLDRLVACWRVAARSGATLAPAIDRVADSLQDDVELRRALAAALAGPRATVRLLAGLPLVGLLLATAIGARPLAFLLGSRAGICCLGAAGLLDAAGVGWARRISRRAQHPTG